MGEEGGGAKCDELFSSYNNPEMCVFSRIMDEPMEMYVGGVFTNSERSPFRGGGGDRSVGSM